MITSAPSDVGGHGNGTNRQCPDCHVSLRPITYEGIEIETCETCGGDFLDSHELAKIVQIRQVKFNEQELQSIAQAEPITGVPVAEVDHPVICPKCVQAMDPVNYGHDSGIIIDRCAFCGGFWLDAGELEKVQMVVEGWDDRLPQIMKEHGQKLRDVSAGVDQAGSSEACRVPLIGRFINSIINGIIDLTA